MKFMSSIQARITAATVCAILISILAVGGMGLYFVRKAGNEDSDREMLLVADNQRQALNSYLDSIMQSVNMVSHFAQENLSINDLVEADAIGSDGFPDKTPGRNWDSKQQRKLNRYLDTYTDDVKTIFQSVSNHTNGVTTYYFRLSPAISNKEKGFWFSKHNSLTFTEESVTDLEAFNPEDISHVGWYYLPLQRGRPSWLDPYYNENIGIEMISYVVPIYKAGTFIGVIGMDVNYETLKKQIQSLEIFDSGYAFMADEEGCLLSHPTLTDRFILSEAVPELHEKLMNIQESEDEEYYLVQYSYNGTDKKAAITTLSNNLKLIVTAPVSEINVNWINLLNLMEVTSLILIVASGIIITIITLQITKPLKRLTEASLSIAEGNYDVELDYDRNDEVGILTNAFRKLVDNLKVYIADLNSKAYKDGLTMVKNKAAFDIFCYKLDEKARDALKNSSPPPEYAIIMFDCNDLKIINDCHGHDKGDLYLRTACELICLIFSHSPVFRLGGDEFAVILQNEDYTARNHLMTSLEDTQKGINERATEPWERVNLAAGLAVYDSYLDENSSSVLKRADERMYINKRKMKTEAE